MTRNNPDSSGGRVSVTGIIVPSEWDDNGQVINIYLSSDKEIEYEISNQDKKEELLILIRKRIRAVGLIRNGSGGRKRFTIEEYSVLRS